MILHLVTLNVIYPKTFGERLQLNPLAGTIALLVGAFLWGPIGLVLGIPLAASVKIVFDRIEKLRPYARWLSAQ